MDGFSEAERLEALRRALLHLNAPEAKVEEMAQQLDKRARQLATERAGSYEEAVGYLIKLMSQGWAASDSGSVPGEHD